MAGNNIFCNFLFIIFKQLQEIAIFFIFISEIQLLPYA